MSFISRSNFVAEKQVTELESLTFDGRSTVADANHVSELSKCFLENG